MMQCPQCNREGLTEKELQIHLKYFHNSSQPIQQHIPKQTIASGICPDCKATIFHEEGCQKCYSCGWTKC